jgi:hypothetical protein
MLTLGDRLRLLLSIYSCGGWPAREVRALDEAAERLDQKNVSHGPGK